MKTKTARYDLPITYDQLAAFVAVVSEGTFKGASQAIHKSQPAVSKLVSNLEAGLGLALLDRSGYRPELTDAGTRFYERARSVLEDTEALFHFGRSLGQPAEPVVRLVIEAITPLPSVLAVLAQVKSRFPQVDFELRTERMGGVVEALDDGDVDVVIAGDHASQKLRNRTTEAQRFTTVRILPVAAPHHPLATLTRPIGMEDLRAHSQIVLQDSGSGELSESVNVLEGGLRWTVTDVEAKRTILLSGMGWGGLPEHVVAEDLQARRLAVLAVPMFDVETVELHAMRRRDRPAGVVAEALWAGLT